MAHQISRQSIFEIWIFNSKQTRIDAIVAYILQKLDDSSLPNNVITSIKITVRGFCQKLEQRWNKADHNRERFLSANSLWLQENIVLSDVVIEALPSSSQGGSSYRSGRPQKDFGSSSSRTQLRKVKHLVESASQEELLIASGIKLQKSGKRDSASIVKELSTASPRRGTTIKKARVSFTEGPAELSPNQALALIINANLSKHQYETIRQQVKGIYSKLYPPYYKVKAAKQLCYPSGITVTETSAEIPLQSLVDRTITRLCEVQKEVLETYTSENNNFNIIIKWGCDGSEQKRYRQKFSE